MTSDEELRLAELRAYRVLDTPREASFDRVVELAADLFGVPMAAISLVDSDRQWFKAKIGIGVDETPRDQSFCSHAIARPENVMVVEDATCDARFVDNPLVTGDPNIRFYAGACLTNPQGHKLGALCVIDDKPHHPSKAMLAQLEILAKLAVGELELARERAGHAEKNRLLALAEHIAKIGHWRLDVATMKVTWSPEVYRIHGVTPETFDPSVENSLVFYTPEDQQRIRESVTSAIASGQDYDFRRQTRGADGVVRQVAGRAVCEFDAAGKVVAMSGIFQDITEHVKTLEAANAAAAVKAEFLANMSHELRTPLTSVIGFAELLRLQPELGDKTKEYVERVINGSQALLATINDVLDFSKLEAGQVEIRRRPTVVAPMIRSIVDLFAPQASAKGIAIQCRIASAVPQALLLDPDRVRQILLNLIGNAVKFTASGGVTVTVDYNAAGRLTLSVRDTGPGIAPDMAARLFKRFSQIDGSLTRAHGGTGLGLAICKGLVEAMDGDIGVDSIPGQGSNFHADLPCAKVEAPSEPIASVTKPPSLGDYRVLAVDDNQANRALVQASLTPTGVELTMAGGGDEAIELASRMPFDLILLDLHMPGTGGQAALTAIRQSPGPNCNIPILAFTAESDAAHTDALIQAGFDGVITKPVLPRALVARISEILAPPPLEARHA
jgi:PAS domain S-box-containing protein